MKHRLAQGKFAPASSQTMNQLKLPSNHRPCKSDSKVVTFETTFKDNERGILPKLLKINQSLRSSEWPQPFNTTSHVVRVADARNLEWIPDRSVHLVVTSPPYWTLKQYDSRAGQLGEIGSYEHFLDELDKAWAECARVLVPGGSYMLRGRRCLHSSQTRRAALCYALACRYPGQDEKDRIGLFDADPVVQNR